LPRKKSRKTISRMAQILWHNSESPQSAEKPDRRCDFANHNIANLH
jgi:hypothetical protein